MKRHQKGKKTDSPRYGRRRRGVRTVGDVPINEERKARKTGKGTTRGCTTVEKRTSVLPKE